MQLPSIHISSSSAELGTIYFVVPRKKVRVKLPDGSVQEYYTESEEQWARKCAVVTGLKSE